MVRGRGRVNLTVMNWIIYYLYAPRLPSNSPPRFQPQTITPSYKPPHRRDHGNCLGPVSPAFSVQSLDNISVISRGREVQKLGECLQQLPLFSFPLSNTITYIPPTLTQPEIIISIQPYHTTTTKKIRYVHSRPNTPIIICKSLTLPLPPFNPPLSLLSLQLSRQRLLNDQLVMLLTVELLNCEEWLYSCP